MGEGEIFASVHNLSYSAIPERDYLRVKGAKLGKRYRMRSVKQYLRISRFGGLIKHITPITLRSDGALVRTADRYFGMVDGAECYELEGGALLVGVPLSMQYSGTGYDPSLRITGDFGSTLYHIEEIKNG